MYRPANGLRQWHLALWMCACGFSNAGYADDTSLVLQGCTLIDVVEGTLRHHVTVVVEGQRIVQVDHDGKAKLPDEATVIDAAGKYLIPGLWDMHVHWYEPEYFSLFTANGVTGIRIMWGMPFHHQWREEISQGQRLGPRMVIASSVVDGPKPVWPGSPSVTNEKEAQEFVQREKLAKADFIKVYSRLAPDAFIALINEANRHKLPVAGHVPTAVTAADAASAGLGCIEHLTRVLLGCSTEEKELHAGYLKLQQDSAEQGAAVWSSPEALLLGRRTLETYSEQKAATLFHHFQRQRTWHCPTLTVNRSIAYLNDPSFVSDPRLKYMSERIRKEWDPANDFRFKDNSPSTYQLRRRTFEKDLEVVKGLHQAGVQLLAGTDVLNPYCFPGFSIHDELGLFVKAGLKPIDALRTATINPARYLGRDAQLGSIEAGKLADLVLLDANPLDDIANTKKISGVVALGSYYDEVALSKMLQQAEQLANKRSIAGALEAIAATDPDAAIEEYRRLRADEEDKYNFGEFELNMLGYRLMEQDKVDAAIAIFQLNVEMYPESSNVYDSLGESYMKAGRKEEAIANYQRSLELDAENANAVKMLEKLRRKE